MVHSSDTVSGASASPLARPSPALVAQTLQSLGSPLAFQPYDALSPDWQQTLQSSVTQASTIAGMVLPETQAELAAVITCAHQNRWRVLPCGNGSKLDWGGLLEGIDLVVSTRSLQCLVEHAVGDLTVTVEAGMPLADLQTTLAQAGQFLPLDPSYSNQATIGGIVASADTGSLRQRYGGVRDLLLGVSLVRADGQLAKAGGRVVKNVAGYDLMKLLTGSYGTLGMISQMTFRVYPLPQASQTTVLVGSGEAIATATRTLLASALTPTAVDLLSPPLVQHLNLGQGLGLVVRFQSSSASVQEQTARLLEVGQALQLTGTTYQNTDEATLWRELPAAMQLAAPETGITCKIGVRPTAVATVLEQAHQMLPQALGQIHAGSGLGRWLLPQVPPTSTLLQLRQLCQAHGGFLSVLQAPLSLKSQFDLWGYAGNALGLMKNLKQQFDPQLLLSPHRFVGGI